MSLCFRPVKEVWNSHSSCFVEPKALHDLAAGVGTASDEHNYGDNTALWLEDGRAGWKIAMHFKMEGTHANVQGVPVERGAKDRWNRQRCYITGQRNGRSGRRTLTRRSFWIRAQHVHVECEAAACASNFRFPKVGPARKLAPAPRRIRNRSRRFISRKNIILARQLLLQSSRFPYVNSLKIPPHAEDADDSEDVAIA